MHYTGTLHKTGSKFDSSLDRGRSFDFVLGTDTYTFYHQIAPNVGNDRY